jgi:glycosyltransferase involved in cell wall biosynthesis
MSRPIRVLELRSVRGTGGGPEKTILLGARHADPARFAVTVCYIRDRRDPDFLIDQRAHELGVDYVEILERHSLDVAVWPTLRALVRDRRIQIVHSHEYKTNLFAWLLGRAEGTIPFSTVHGWFGRGTSRERLYYAGDKRILSHFPRLVAVSSALRDELVRTGTPTGVITVIPNGIDHRQFTRMPERRDGIRRDLGLQADEIVIGAVGRLERQKRFDLLMEAVSMLRRRHSKLRLMIVGDGSLKHALVARREALELGAACMFLGHRSDVPLLHHAFDLFVQASDGEGSPNVVLEAMALGTPVVVTDVGGTADIVTDGVHGLLVPPGRVPALSDAIDRVLRDPLGAVARAQAARLRVDHELSFDTRTARVEAMYEEIVAR